MGRVQQRLRRHSYPIPWLGRGSGLGAFNLDSSSVTTRADDLTTLGAALTEDGDLLLYGCEVASGEGQDFITALAQATQADVAASDDLTGSAELGGDWDLETNIGEIESNNLVIGSFEMTLVPSDTTAPTFDSSPSASNIADITLDLTADINEAGKVYYIVVADGAQAPTAAQVKAGVSYGDINGRGAAVITSGSATVSSGAFSNTFNVTGLTASTAYDIYVVAEDDEGIPNLQSAVTKVDATTIAPANQAPTISDAPSDITVTEDTASNVDLSAVTFADSDGDSLTATLTASAGTLAASSGGSVTVSGSGTGTLTLVGTAANINTFLDTTTNVNYTGDTNVSGENAATLSIKANDGTIDSSISIVNLDITDVNDAPILGSQSGILASAIGAGTDRAYEVAVQVDGKAVVVGYSWTGTDDDIALLRYNTDGTLDDSFGDNGVVLTSFSALGTATNTESSTESGDDRAYAIVIDANGKIVVVGQTVNDANGTESLAVRYNTDGTIDTSFGTNGFFVYDEPGALFFWTVQTTSDGGYLFGYQSDSTLIKVNSAGSLDTNWGGDGSVKNTTYSTATSAGFSSNSDGSVYQLLNDPVNKKIIVSKYTATGTVDTNFGTSGVIELSPVYSGMLFTFSSSPVSFNGNDVFAITSTGYLDGSFILKNELVKINLTSGNVDTSFGVNGYADLSNVGFNQYKEIIIDANGKVNVIGNKNAGGDADYQLVRLNANGLMDTTFGASGKVTTDLDSRNNYAWGADIDASGSIFVAGNRYQADGNNDFVLAKYNSDGSLNSSFKSAVAYTENGTPSVIFTSLTISDVDNTVLSSATVTIDTGFTVGDVLSFVNDNATMGNVTASYNTANGILTLTSAGATATLAQWQSALRAVTYASSSDTPTSVSSSRKMSIAVSDGQSVSNTLQETVAITAVNDVPTITNTPADLTVIENSASNIDLSSIVFVDADNSSATVTLTASSGSLSAASGSGSLTIVNTNSGELTISGGLSDINSYLDTTSNIKYTGAVGVSGDNAATLTIKANDGVVDSSASIINLDITDTTAPNATSTPDLATASDSGVSNVDNITNDTTPTLTGTSEANASVKLYDTDGTTLLGTTTADGSGNWSITSSALSTGSHTLTTKATDAAGNVSVASSGLTITVDDTAPTLSSSNPADEAVSVAPSGDITLTFSEDIAKGYDEITLINVTTGATVETFDVLNGSNLTYTGNTVTLNPTANLDEATTYAIRVDGNAVRDTAGNTYAGISDNTTLNFTTGVTDGAAPTFLSIQRADDNTITGSTTSFTLAFNEAVNAVAGDFELNAGGSVAGTIGSITGSGTNTITVNVTGISGIGTLGLNLKSGHAVTDLAGNALATAEPADDEVYTVDTVAPTLISINRVDSEMTNADSVQFMAVFSENVTGLSADDFELTGTATSGASIASVTGTGNGLVITVNGASGDGSLGVQLKSAATVTDTAGTALTATTASAVTERYTIDNTAPTATAIITTNTALSTADTVTFDVTFDGSVTNVNADDFEISGDVTGTVTSVTGSGSSYTVTVGSITGDGALGLNFKSSQNITDTSGNSFAGTEPSTDESYTIDNTLPTVASISRGMVNQVKAGTATDVVFTVVFSETVSGVASSDFAVTGNATNTGVSSVSSTDGKVFKVTVAGVNGTIGQTLGLSFTGSADDALSQASTATFTAGDTYTIAGTLLNEGALTQTQLDAIEDLNRVGTLLEQSVADATQVVIVDSRVPGLVDLTKQANPNADIWLLDGSRSAVEQITEILANYSDLEALHILSHGGVGEVYLGAETLSESSITENSGVYAAWGNALSENGDILLYGCNVAQGDAGLDFINQLAQVTGADIAASDDLTGSAMLGGDWVLEVKNGEVEDGSLLDIALFETYDRTLETVNFSGLGASDSGGPGFKVVTDNRFIVSNNLTLDGTVAYPSTSAAGQTFIFKADGTDAKTFTVDDMKISSFVNQAYSKGATVTFKGINGGVIETLTLANGKTLNTTSVSIFSWFESSFSSVQGVASIEYYLPDKTQNFQFDNFNLSEFANSDITAPVFESSTPSVSNIADITLDLTADINEAGKVYYIVVADGAQAPTAAQVKAGVSYGDINGRGAAVITSGSATVSSGAFSNTFNVTGLTASTSYDIYVVAEDDEGTPNLQSAVTKVDATTIAPVNQAPTLSGAAASQAVNDAATMSPFGAITLADVDNDNVSVTVALDTAAKGGFTATSLTTSGFTDAGSGSYTLSSTTLASAQAALRALVFDPADNRVAVGSTETTTFTITVNDGTVNGTNNTTTVISTSINDTPTDMALSDASYNHSEGASNVVVGSFSATDADTGESFSYSLVTGAGDTNNGLFNINGADLRITERADVPAGTYSVRVQVSDGDATYEKAFSITVSDDQAPSISTVVPNDNATGVSVADSIQITFDEAVQLGSSGTITLYDITGAGANSVSIDVTSHASQLSIAGNVLTIDPTSNLIATNQYAVQFTAGVLKDDTGNAITAVNDTTSYNFTTGTVDTSAPTVAIVDVADPTQPNAGTITINFSEQVANVDISDFTLTKDGSTVDISGLSVAGSGRAYTLDLSTATATEGTYVLTLATSNITDTSGNVLSAGDSESFVIDTTASTGVAIVRAGAETINGSAATFTAVFSEAVSGVDAADFTLTGTATGGTVSSVTQVSDSVYTVSVTGLTSDGTLGVDLNSTGTGITDTAGNAISGGKVGQQIIRDTTGPSVVAINRDGAALTTADTATFTVSFNEAVTGVDVSDFSLTAGATGNISSVTGSGSTYQVTVNSIEGNGALRLDLKASGTGITDTAGNAISAGFTSGDTLTIDNTAAVVTGSQSVTLDEGMASGTIIGQVKATDSNGISEFSIQSGNEAGYFTIDNNGVLALTSAGALAIDHETLSTYTLVIVAKDAIGQASSAVDVTISINDVNDNVPVFSSLETASINENSALTVVVYDANATDADSSSVHNTLTYSLKATGDHSVFTIDSSTGEVKLNAVADYETKASYGFTVIATDGMRSTEKAVTLSITDLNDNTPVITSGTTGSVNENAATSTVIYTATGTDADGTATNNTLRYSLTGTDAALLNINATTGAVTLKASADYETKDSYSFNVVATDNGAGNYNSGSLNIDKAVTVSVNDLNDNTPVITSGTTGSVNENAATSTVIYTATGTDADGTATNNTLRYSLTGTDAALLNINATTGAVTLKASADYETKDSYSFNVVATDNGAGNYNSGSLNIDKAVTVSVNDLNDNTPVITSGTTGSVNENAATSTVIYTATGTDADGTATNNTLRYSLTGTDAALLNINATTGAVTLKASADYETKDSYSFNVVATDNGAGNYNSGSLNIDKAVTVSINNLNDNAPTVSASSASAVIIEAGGVKNAVFSTNTATMILTKGDADGFVVYDTAYLASNGWVTADSGATYSKVGVYGAATFTLSTGQVSYALNNDIDATQTLTFGQIVTDRFVVQVTDNLVTDTVDAVFNITGANDAPTVSASLVAMTGTSGQVFVPVTLPADLFADVDANEVNTLVWSMENLPTGLVFNPVARTLSGTPQGGFEGINALNVVATDAQGAQVKAPVTLTLRPAPAISSSDAPVAPSQQVAITETPLLASLPDLPNNNNGLPAGTVETVSGEVSGFGTDSNSAPTAAEAPLVQPAAAVPNGNIIAESRVVVNVGANGQVQVSDAQAGVANITDLSVASLSVLPDRVSISIIDAKPGGSYSATLADGTGLPSWVEVNPTTGQVTLTPPQGQGSISLKINAVDADGNIRVLEVEVDLDNLPPALDIENNAPSVTMNRGEVFVPLSEQLAQAGEQYDDYGSDLMTLLVS
ncbi:DUF4347 domain-containing protein [Marinomonas sp. IMCC 4694]|uniref:DUF4347 domain-containing protein n=1 Tax=Marinomonas sp. IMCC 4694 TaxID=2605432 RepID=UPI0011E71D2D|nr:DUF4347 domain-containing protein [Marinomonas sp. IMCC 4694]TYL48324.1 DUF4347 domain-containing protein [Marinomonas sp. IMCC 4694]